METRLQKHIANVNGIGEWLFALFLFAGYYKADPRFDFIQAHIDLTVLFLILSFFVVIYRLLKNRIDLSKKRNNRVIAVILFFSLAVFFFLSLFYSESKQYGGEKALRFLVLTGWAFIGVFLLIRDNKSLRYFVWAIVFISTAMAIDSLLRYGENDKIEFITAFGSNYIALSRATGLGLLSVLFYLFPNEQKKTRKLWLLGISGLLLWAMLSSGARGPVISLGLAIVLLLIFTALGIIRTENRRMLARLGIIIASVVVIVITFGDKLFPTLMLRMNILFYGGGSSALERVDFFGEAFDLWIDSPIWGKGIGQFGWAIWGQDIREYPHNILLELAAETGLIGLGLFLAIISLSIKNLFICCTQENRFSKKICGYLLPAFCFCFLNALISGDINDNRILFTMVGLLVNLTAYTKPERKISFSNLL